MSSASQLQAFLAASTALIAKTKAIAAALPANTTQVWPGGTTFTSIQAAINSISSASAQEQYQVAVGSGTYNETVTMKDYVYVIGAEQSLTTITAPPAMNFASGVVNSASGCGISELTINAPGAGWGSCPMGIKISGAGFFHISGVTINSGTAGIVGNNVRGICNNTGSYSGNIIIGSSQIVISGGDSSVGVGVDIYGFIGVTPPTVTVNLTAIQVNPGESQSFGVTTSGGATVLLEDSKISAATWALYNSDGSSLITANQCSIDGPVSGGVVVNN